MDILEGQIIDGLYRIIKARFGKGGAGEIHLAQDFKGKKVILKFILTGGIVKNLEEFKKEYQALLKFSHPNVAKVFNFGEHDGNFFIVYEYIEGEQFCKAVLYKKAEEMVPLFIQALEGLQAIHTAGFLHLDIKSANVLVTCDSKVKIIDFGLVQVREKASSKLISGSIQYMAPEMVLREALDHGADIFSLGCLMYKCSAGGRVPFPGREASARNVQKLQEIISSEALPAPPSHYGAHVPPYLDEIILKCLEQDPSRRFISARAVMNALKTRHPEYYKESPEALGSYLIPKGDRHIGREPAQEEVIESLNELIAGRQPGKAVFWIRGAEGMGKTHFLKKIKGCAEQQAEKLFIHSIELPKDFLAIQNGDQTWLEEWILHLKNRLGENKKPLVVLVDNFSADNGILETIKSLLSALNRRKGDSDPFREIMPCMVCLTGDRRVSEIGKIIGFQGSFTEIELPPFGEKEIEKYLKSVPAFKGKKVPKEWISALYARTGGSPKELTEILKERESRGLLFDLNGEIFVAHAEDASIEVSGREDVPESSKKRLSNQLAGLSEPERKCLEWITVWSWMDILPSISLEVIRSLTGLDRLPSVLNMLVSNGILTQNFQQQTVAFANYSFLPALIYQELGEEKTRRMHQKVFETLEQKEIKDKKFKEALLFHQANGSLERDSLRALIKLTGKWLNEEGRVFPVKKLFEKTLPAVKQKPKLFVYLAGKFIEACHYAGDYQKGMDIYRETLLLLEKQKTVSNTLKILLVISILPVLIESHQFDTAKKLIEEQTAILGRSDSHYILIFQNFRAWLFRKRFHLAQEGGKALLETAKNLYSKSQEAEGRLHPQQRKLIRNNNLGIVLFELGENAKAVDSLLAKLKRLKKNTNIFIEYVARVELAEAFRNLKNYEGALRHAGKAMRLAQKTGQGKWIQHSHAVMASIHQAKGTNLRLKKKTAARKEFKLALKENDCSLAATACLENRSEAEASSVLVFIRKGQCCQELGDFQSAIANFEAALHYKPSQVNQCVAYLGLGESHAEEGDTLSARIFLNKAKEGIKGLPKYIADHCQFNILKGEAKCLALEKKKNLAHELLPLMKVLADKDSELGAEFKNFIKTHLVQ